ncbi:MAG: hypothetical protein BEU01_01855 [Marine Group III euryarchaeote CG-Epi4]|uniref:DUF5050 domain-containing protein n=1 Tax=Marine Group III euryarchaeote CG-Epi4 TaxID=1888998 RepID=A0A1J5U2F5_9ARCH|nr:MAG: hypothetical protein BEU01_01855 [Marine Group III euryarchaeote CG-Epi4]
MTTFTGCIDGEDTSSTDEILDPVSNLDEEELSQRFANLTASYENLAADLSTLAANYETALTKNIELQNDIKDLEVEIAVTNTHNEVMNSTIADQEQELSNLRDELETSNSHLDMAHDSFENLNSSFNSLEDDFNAYKFDLESLQSEYSMLDNNFSMLEIEYDNLSTQYNELFVEFDDLSTEYDDMMAEFEEWKTYQSITNWNFDGDCPNEYVMSYSSGIDNGDNNGDAGNHVLEDGEIDHSASVCKPGMLAITNYTSGYINDITEFNGKFYYRFEGSADFGEELWTSDYYGNAEMLKDINTGEADSYPWFMGQTEDLLFFRATTSINGYELWVTDGTESGTNMVKDIDPGTNSGFYGYYGFHYFNDKFYFGANNGTTGEELWATDGTENGTYLVKEIRGEDSNGNNYGSSPNSFTTIGDTMYFIANDGEHGSEPWMTDGTANGTRMLKDIREEDSNGNNYGSTYCYYHCFFEFGDKLWFNADDGTHGRELWYTDGTEAGTLMFSDIRDGSSGSNPNIYFNTEDYFYFVAHDGDSYRLFMTDGKQMIMDLDVHSSNIYISGTPVMYDGEFYMSLRTQPTGYELWKSDGTPEGTVMVHEFWSGTTSGDPQNLMVVNNNLLFMIAYPGGGNTYYHNLFAYAVEDYEI